MWQVARSTSDECQMPTLGDSDECRIPIHDGEWSTDECQIVVLDDSSDNYSSDGDVNEPHRSADASTASRSCPWEVLQKQGLRTIPEVPSPARTTSDASRKNCMPKIPRLPLAASNYYYEQCVGVSGSTTEPCHDSDVASSTHTFKQVHFGKQVEQDGSNVHEKLLSSKNDGHEESYGTVTPPRARIRRVATPCAAKEPVTPTIRLRRKGELKITSVARQKFVNAWGSVSATIWWALLMCDMWVGYVVLNCVVWAAHCECDQPLWRYLAVGWALLSGLTTGVVDKVAILVSVRHAMLCEAFIACFSFAWLVQGCMWVARANRCGATSPMLFWTAWASTTIQWNFIYLTIIVSIIFMTASAFSFGKEA